MDTELFPRGSIFSFIYLWYEVQASDFFLSFFFTRVGNLIVSFCANAESISAAGEACGRRRAVIPARRLFILQSGICISMGSAAARTVCPAPLTDRAVILLLLLWRGLWKYFHATTFAVIRIRLKLRSESNFRFGVFLEPQAANRISLTHFRSLHWVDFRRVMVSGAV